MATWDDVRELALELPETEESTSWRQPALRVCGKWFCGLSPHEKAPSSSGATATSAR